MTGLIYVVIIALWAAVLIPMWLRRHDQISEVRSTARFSSAMKTLSGQGQPQYAMDLPYAMDSPYLMQADSSPRTRSTRPEVPMRPTTDMRREGMDPAYERELARQQAATRRAAVLGVLTLALLAALVLAVLSIVPRWVPFAAALPLVAFVLAAAMTASGRSAARPARRAGTARGRRTERPARDRAAEPVDAGPVAPAAAEDDWETWNAWDDDDAWDAVPTTLPTYVTAPRASAVPRGIDRSRPGEWTGEAMVETAQSMRSRPRADSLSRPPVAASDDTAELPAVADGYAPRRVG